MNLKGKTVLFLGSSVTYGAASGGVSFVEIIAKQCGFNYIKEAVSGTTLADTDENSYASRLKKIDKNLKIDLFVCQLSTNDSYKGIPLEKTKEAIIFIIDYVKSIFGCPVVFYTGTRFQSDGYGETVNLLKKLQKECRFGFLDLWDDEDMLGVNNEDYKRYMSDGVHPTLEGYRDWWAPKFVSFLLNFD
ncbi:MAG: SGNH/GDSL hydrolase family protein [Clostridia bacterium]|nr:SGNH/GDSL hydrolase family protein [Clostridia bacterium]